MSDIFIQIVLAIFGLFFFGTGVMSFMRPAAFAEKLSLAALHRSGEVEIRAQYGGFFFAAGLSQLVAFAGLVAQSAAFIIALVIFGGLILGRLGSLMFDSKGEALIPMIRNLFWIDGVGTVLAVTGLYLIGR